MPPDFITIVSGLPRSGTSLMMQMLVAGGLPALTDEARPPDQSNPRGYLEFERVKRLRSDQSWVAEARGKAVKIIHLLLSELPLDGRFDYRVLLMRRSIAEVVASQRSMLTRLGKPSASAETLAPIFQRQLASAEQLLGSHPCFRYRAINYCDLIERPLETARAINSFLEDLLNPDAMAKAVDPTLYRERG